MSKYWGTWDFTRWFQPGWSTALGLTCWILSNRGLGILPCKLPPMLNLYLFGCIVLNVLWAVPLHCAGAGCQNFPAAGRICCSCTCGGQQGDDSKMGWLQTSWKRQSVWFLDFWSVFGRKLSNFMPESCRRLLRGAWSCCLYRPEKSDVLFGPLGLLFTISGNVDKAQPAKNSHFYMGYLWPSRVPTDRNACLVQTNVLASCTSAIVCFDWPWWC